MKRIACLLLLANLAIVVFGGAALAGEEPLSIDLTYLEGETTGLDVRLSEVLANVEGLDGEIRTYLKARGQ